MGTSKLVLFLVLLCMSWSEGGLYFRCPLHPCVCASGDMGLVMNCRQRFLTRVPPVIPSELLFEEISLKKNNIRHLGPGAFKGIRVKKIDLSENIVTSIDDEAFGGVENSLEELVIQVYNMNGLPLKALSKLKVLRVLHVIGCKVPVLTNSTFSSLSNIQEIRLISCGIEIVEPNAFLGLEPTLKVLDFFGNDLRTIPSAALTGLVNVEKMVMTGNHLKQIKKKALQGMTNLRHLELSSNEIYYINPMAFDGVQSSLEFLGLQRNRLRGKDLVALRILRNLNQLELAYNQIENIPRRLFRNLSKVTLIGLQSNKIRGINRLTFAGTEKDLKVLLLSDNDVNIIAPNTFQGFRKLRHLYLDRTNAGSGLSRHSFRGLAGSLETLNMQRSGFMASGFLAISDLSELKTLVLRDNQITSLPPRVFYKLHRLTRLDLQGNKLQSITNPETFQGLEKSLRQLVLSNNMISTLSECVFEKFEQLRDIVLNQNPLQCDCQIHWLKQWVISKTSTFSRNTLNWICAGPPQHAGKLFRAVKDEEMTCEDNSPKSLCQTSNQILSLSTSSPVITDFKSTGLPKVHPATSRNKLEQSSVTIKMSTNSFLSLPPENDISTDHPKMQLLLPDVKDPISSQDSFYNDIIQRTVQLMASKLDRSMTRKTPHKGRHRFQKPLNKLVTNRNNTKRTLARWLSSTRRMHTKPAWTSRQPVNRHNTGSSTTKTMFTNTLPFQRSGPSRTFLRQEKVTTLSPSFPWTSRISGKAGVLVQSGGFQRNRSNVGKHSFKTVPLSKEKNNSAINGRMWNRTNNKSEGKTGSVHSQFINLTSAAASGRIKSTSNTLQSKNSSRLVQKIPEKKARESLSPYQKFRSIKMYPVNKTTISGVKSLQNSTVVDSVRSETPHRSVLKPTEYPTKISSKSFNNSDEQKHINVTYRSKLGDFSAVSTTESLLQTLKSHFPRTDGAVNKSSKIPEVSTKAGIQSPVNLSLQWLDSSVSQSVTDMEKSINTTEKTSENVFSTTDANTKSTGSFISFIDTNHSVTITTVYHQMNISTPSANLVFPKLFNRLRKSTAAARAVKSTTQGTVSFPTKEGVLSSSVVIKQTAISTTDNAQQTTLPTTNRFLKKNDENTRPKTSTTFSSLAQSNRSISRSNPNNIGLVNTTVARHSSTRAFIKSTQTSSAVTQKTTIRPQNVKSAASVVPSTSMFGSSSTVSTPRPSNDISSSNTSTKHPQGTSQTAKTGVLSHPATKLSIPVPTTVAPTTNIDNSALNITFNGTELRSISQKQTTESTKPSNGSFTRGVTNISNKMDEISNSLKLSKDSISMNNSNGGTPEQVNSTRWGKETYTVSPTFSMVSNSETDSKPNIVSDEGLLHTTASGATMQLIDDKLVTQTKSKRFRGSKSPYSKEKAEPKHLYTGKPFSSWGQMPAIKNWLNSALSGQVRKYSNYTDNSVFSTPIFPVQNSNEGQIKNPYEILRNLRRMDSRLKLGDSFDSVQENSHIQGNNEITRNTTTAVHAERTNNSRKQKVAVDKQKDNTLRDTVDGTSWPRLETTLAIRNRDESNREDNRNDKGSITQLPDLKPKFVQSSKIYGKDQKQNDRTSGTANTGISPKQDSNMLENNAEINKLKNKNTAASNIGKFTTILTQTRATSERPEIISTVSRDDRFPNISLKDSNVTQDRNYDARLLSQNKSRIDGYTVQDFSIFVSIFPYASNAVKVSWNVSHDYAVSEFRVYYGDADNVTLIEGPPLEGTVRTYDVTSLIPKEIYTFCVVAFLSETDVRKNGKCKEAKMEFEEEQATMTTREKTKTLAMIIGSYGAGALVLVTLLLSIALLVRRYRDKSKTGLYVPRSSPYWIEFLCGGITTSRYSTTVLDSSTATVSSGVEMSENDSHSDSEESGTYSFDYSLRSLPAQHIWSTADLHTNLYTY